MFFTKITLTRKIFFAVFMLSAFRLIFFFQLSDYWRHLNGAPVLGEEFRIFFLNLLVEGKTFLALPKLYHCIFFLKVLFKTFLEAEESLVKSFGKLSEIFAMNLTLIFDRLQTIESVQF